MKNGALPGIYCDEDNQWIGLRWVTPEGLVVNVEIEGRFDAYVFDRTTETMLAEPMTWDPLEPDADALEFVEKMRKARNLVNATLEERKVEE